MLLSLNDQENATHHAAQNSKKFFPKTPGQGPKTPFPGKKISLNDENGFTTMKGKSVFDNMKADAFMTPMGPRNRVPLGGKDTNVKARNQKNFEGNDGPPQKTVLKQKPATPAQAPASVRAPRSARLSISESTRPVLKGEDEDYPEVEYCPPQPVPLPDIPDDYIFPNLEVMKSNLYKDMFRDEYSYINEALEKSLNSTEEEDKILAEHQAKGFGSLRGKRIKTANNECKTIGKAQGRQLSSTLNPLKQASKNSLNIKKVPSITSAKDGKQPLQAKSYEIGTVSSMTRRLPTSRPTSSASSKAASLLSLQPQHTQSQPLSHKRSATSVQSRVIGGNTKSTSGASNTSPNKPRSRSAASITRGRLNTSTNIIHPKLAEANSKTTIGYHAGRPLAKKIKRSLDLNMDQNQEVDDDVNMLDESNSEDEVQNKAMMEDFEEEDRKIVEQLKTIYMGDLAEEDEECFQIPVLE